MLFLIMTDDGQETRKKKITFFHHKNFVSTLSFRFTFYACSAETIDFVENLKNL
jgi:hypothetical protein